MKTLNPIFSEILSSFTEQTPCEDIDQTAPLQARPTSKEIYTEYHESREDLQERGYGRSCWF